MNIWKRVLSLFLVVFMFISMIPTSAFAAGEEDGPLETAPEHTHGYTAVVTEATCTADGYTTYTCECGDSYVADTVAAGHSWGEWSEAEGLRTRVCAACGETEQETIPETDEAVAAVQAMIDELNPVVTTEAERDAVWAAMDVIDPAIEALTPAQRAQLNTANYDAAVDAAAAFSNEEYDDPAMWAAADGWYWVGDTLYIKDGSITQAKLYAAIDEHYGSGTYKYAAAKPGLSWDMGGTQLSTTSTAAITVTEGAAAVGKKGGTSLGDWTGWGSKSTTYTFTVAYYYDITLSIIGCDTGSVTYNGTNYTNGQSFDFVKGSNAIAMNTVEGYNTPSASGVGLTPAESGTLTVTYTSADAVKHTVTLNVVGGDYGTASLSENGEVAENTPVTITATPKEATDNAVYSVDIAVTGATLEGNSFTVGSSDVNVTVTFSMKSITAVSSTESEPINVGFNGGVGIADQLTEVQEELYTKVLASATGLSDLSWDDFTYQYLPEKKLDLGWFDAEWIALTANETNQYYFGERFSEGGIEQVKLTHTATGLNITAYVKLEENRQPIDKDAITLSTTAFSVDTMDQVAAAVAAAVRVNGADITDSHATVNVAADAQSATVTINTAGSNYLPSVDGGKNFAITVSINEYTLTWNANGGKWGEETAKTTTQPYGEAISAPVAPEKEQSVSTVYTFAGWDGSDEDNVADASLGTVSGAATFNAVWAESAREYVITWKIGEITETTKVGYGSVPVHADPDSTDNTSFDGWKDETGNVYKEDLPAVSGAATYTAVFTNDTVYTIVFKANAEDESALYTQRINVTKDPTATVEAPLEVPTKEGFVFDGWDPALVGTVPTQNETIVAKWAPDANANGVDDNKETATVTTTVIAGEGSIALSGSEKTIIDGTTVIFDSAAEGGNVLTVVATPADSGSSAIRNVLKSVSHTSLTLDDGGVYTVTAEFSQDKLELNSGAKVYVNKNTLSDRITGLKEKVLNVAVVNYTGNPADYKVVVDATFNYDLDNLNALGQTGLATVLLGNSAKFVITYDGLSASTDIALADSRQVLAIEVSGDVSISAETEPADLLQQIKNVVRITATDPQTGTVTVLANSDSYFNLGDYEWPADDLSDEFEVTVKVNGGNETYQNTVNATVKLSCTDTTPVYTVIYNVDGVEEKFARLLAGADMPTVADPEKDYYTFAGWSPAVSATVVAPAEGKTITYTATWTVNNDNNQNEIPDETETYTVIYTDGVEGEEIFADQKSENCVWGKDTPAAPEIPDREGWNFKGWTPDWKSVVTAPAEKDSTTITYTAEWSQYFVVSFEDRGEPYSTPQEVAPNDTATKPRDPVWAEGDEDHDFLGWFVGDEAFDFETAITGNVKLTAKWSEDYNHNDIDDNTEPHYTVIYKDGEEEVEKFEDVLVGLNTPTVDDLVKENYKFDGWDPAVSETVTGNVTYIAKWLDDINGNDVSDAEETVTITVNKAEENDKVEVIGAMRKGETDQWVYDSTTSETTITVKATPVTKVENLQRKSVSYVDSITVDNTAAELSFNNYAATMTVPAANGSEIVVNFKPAAFVYKDERLMNYNDSMEKVEDKAVFDTMVEKPAYDDADKVTVQYKARGAMSHDINIDALDLSDTLKALIKIFVPSGIYTIEMDDLWLDVNHEVKDSVSLEQAVSNVLTSEALSTIKSWSDFTSLINRVTDAAMYYGAHNFGTNNSDSETVTEQIRLSYKNAALNIEDESTVTLKDLRTATTLQGNNVSLIYRDYTDEDLVAAIAPTVVGADGVTLSGAEIICLDITDPYTYDGQNASDTAYQLKMKFPGNSSYKSCETTFSVTITKADLKMDLPNVIATYGKGYSTEANYTFGNAYPERKEVDDSLIKFVVGLDVADISVSQDGVTGIDGTVQIFLNAELQSMLDKIAGISGSDGLTMSVTDLLKYLIPAGEGTTGALKGIFDELAGLTELGELEVKVGGSMPTETGVYLYGAVSTSSNYDTAYDVAYLVIQPDAQRVWLDFNYNDTNGIFTYELLSQVDLGASAYNDEALTERNDLASGKINNLFLGADQNGEFIARLFNEDVDPETLESELGTGAYTQLAYIAEFANQMHYAVPIFRAFAIVPNSVTVEIEDNEGTEFKRTFDNAPQELDVKLTYTSGTAIVPDEQYLTVTYTGIQTNTKTYESETAPTHSGIYLVTATYIQKDDTGSIVAVGADAETLVIQPAATETIVDDKIVEKGTVVTFPELITIGTDSGVRPDTTVVTAQVASDGSFADIGWDAVKGNVNVDFPRWMDELLAEHMPSVKDGLTATELANLIDNRLPQLLEWLGENTTPELVRSVTNAFADLDELLTQIPESATLTFDDIAALDTSNVGAYLVAAIVTDSDHWSSADSGLLVVLPATELVHLKWNYEDENNIWTRELLAEVDLLATAYTDEHYTTVNEGATKLISYSFLSVDENGEIVIYKNADELDNGVYTELAFIELEVDGDMVLSDLIARPLVIAPNTAEVVFVDENGNVNADRLFTYDKLPHAMTAQVRVDGKVITPDEGELIVKYVGLRSNGEVYNSTSAPTRAGTYTVYATYADRDENGFILRAGAAVGAMVIKQAESTISVTGSTVSYDGEGHRVTVETDAPDVTLISGFANITGDSSEAGLEDLVAEMNIDFPAWLDTYLSVQFADAYTNGVDSADVIFKLNQHKAKLLELGVSENMLAELITELKKIPTSIKVTFFDNITYSEPGTYLWMGIVTDSDYLPAYDTGLLEIVPVQVEIELIDNTKVYGKDDPTLEYVAKFYDNKGNELDVADVVNVTVTRTEGENVGEYVISGIAELTDSVHYTLVAQPEDAIFTITPANIVSFTASNSFYSAAEQTAVLTVIGANGEKLVEGVDYEIISGNKATEVGDYTVTVKGIGNYAGECIAQWTVKAADITSVEVSSKHVYNGEEQTVTLVVKAGEVVLAETDYTVEGNKATEAGQYTVKVTGTDNFAGDAVAKWTIEKASAAIVVADVAVTDGDAPEFSATVTDAQGNPINVDFAIVYAVTDAEGNVVEDLTNLVPGEYTVTVTYSPVQNYEVQNITAGKLTVINDDVEVNIEVNDSTVTEGDVPEFSATVTDAQGNPVDADFAIAYVVTDAQGNVVEDLTDLAPGEYTVTATYTPVEGYVVRDIASGKLTVEKIEYKTANIKTAYQIRLIEPWALRINVRITDEASNTIDYSTLKDYGMYAIRRGQLSNTELDIANMTIEDLKAEPNVIHFTMEDGTAVQSGNYVTATFFEGLYTYRLNQDVIWALYYETDEGVFATTVKERNLYDLMYERKDSTSSTYYEAEKRVYADMVELFNKVTDYRSDFANQGDIVLQNTDSMATTDIRFAEASTDGKYGFARAQQIGLIEPWGMRLNTRIYTPDNTSGVIDYNTLTDYGVIVFHDKDGVVSAENLNESAEFLSFANKDKTYVFSASQGTTEIAGKYAAAVFNDSIYTYELDSTIYYMFFAQDGDEFYYSQVYATNIRTLAKDRAVSSSTTYTKKEKRTYAAMVDLCDSVTAYREWYKDNIG